MDLEDLIQRVQTLYREVDEAVSGFQRASGLSCPPGCGACCQKPVVEASVLEFLPAAARMWASGSAQSYLEAADRAENPYLCILHQPGHRPGEGCCTWYPHRPLVCRLFGFSGRLNKHGRPELVTCRIIRGLSPPPHDLASMPLMPHYQVRLEAEHPVLAGRRPINVALREALVFVGSRLVWRRWRGSALSPLLDEPDSLLAS